MDPIENNLYILFVWSENAVKIKIKNAKPPNSFLAFYLTSKFLPYLIRILPIFSSTPFSSIIFRPQTETDQVRLTDWPISTINNSGKFLIININKNRSQKLYWVGLYFSNLKKFIEEQNVLWDLGIDTGGNIYGDRMTKF